VVFELNDRGRHELQNNIGPEVASIEGTLRSATDSQFVLSVIAVKGIYGSYSKWTGEQVTIRPEHVRYVRERRYSSGRTFALAGAVASGTLAFIVTRGLLGGATPPDPGGNPPPPPPDN
jgi:hypothetical protein